MTKEFIFEQLSHLTEKGMNFLEEAGKMSLEDRKWFIEQFNAIGEGSSERMKNIHMKLHKDINIHELS